MQYFWWSCRRNLTLITLGSERVNPDPNMNCCFARCAAIREVRRGEKRGGEGRVDGWRGNISGWFRCPAHYLILHISTEPLQHAHVRKFPRHVRGRLRGELAQRQPVSRHGLDHFLTVRALTHTAEIRFWRHFLWSAEIRFWRHFLRSAEIRF